MRDLLGQHQFKALFIQLGWDNFDQSQTIDAYKFHGIAIKGGLPVFVCQIENLNQLSRVTALDLDNQLAKFAAEHIIIWHDENSQLWQFSKREIGKGNRFNRFGPFPNSHSFADLIARLKGLNITLDDEIAALERGGFGIVEIAARINRNFDVDNVSKKFYDGFKKQRDALLSFLDGLDGRAREEYASLTLTRLMFLYFMQAKGFLMGDNAYLRHHFENPNARLQDGDDFYHGFLCPLFFQVLSRKRDDRFAGKNDDDKRGFAVFGDLIYLNGGLFARRDFENVAAIGIDDAFFKGLFDFFDGWNWVLDDRPTRDGREINPDVLGYVFEKFINQKQMGAYYTKEDITGYIARNSIVPFLFEKAAPDSKRALDLVRHNPDRYIYGAVKHGCELDLPDYIARGTDDVAARGRWNETATSDLGLPTEIWREVVARRARYFALVGAPDSSHGAVTFNSVADLITHNLDIELWMTDVIANLETQDEVWRFWGALEEITVLDPTVGSGAFLFAAMNILEPLYREVLGRMDEVVADFDERRAKHSHLLAGRVEEFRGAVRQMEGESNRGYSTFKKMMVSNLYGVDIMGEAVEICKLRLFLKLAAQATPQPDKPNLGIEPLPDIDFNIRAGNTLVGFATLKEAEKAAVEQLALGISWADVEHETRQYGAALENFREKQRQQEQIALEDKRQLERAHDHLIASFDLFLGGTYAQSPKSQPALYHAWRQSHQPFHWCAEFYNVMQSGGFDVIIGNPPYVEYPNSKIEYAIKDYTLEGCGNLYTYIIERCKKISPNSSFGMIIPLSAISTDRMVSFMSFLKSDSRSTYLSNFSWRPGKLFEGANLQLSIVLQPANQFEPLPMTTNYLLWESVARPNLFSKIRYAASDDMRLPGAIPKIGSDVEQNVLKKIRATKKELGGCFVRSSNNKVFYRRGGLYWKVFVDYPTHSSEEKIINVEPSINKFSVIAALSSSLWFWYLMATSDCRHLGNRDINTFNFDPRTMKLELRQELQELGRKYVQDLTKNAEDTIRVYRETGTRDARAVNCLSFKVNQSKPIIDEIDRVLAGHYGFTDEELDFIINTDIKYRMGREAGGDGA